MPLVAFSFFSYSHVVKTFMPFHSLPHKVEISDTILVISHLKAKSEVEKETRKALWTKRRLKKGSKVV